MQPLTVACNIEMALSADDRKEKCDRSKTVRRAHRGVTTKLIKEVDEIIGTDPEAVARLKVIHQQLDSKMCF